MYDPPVPLSLARAFARVFYGLFLISKFNETEGSDGNVGYN